MSAYDLPVALEVAGKEYGIRSDFRAVLDILIAMTDPDLSDYEKEEVMIEILYEDDIPASGYEEACEKAVKFIDANISPDSKPRHRLMDWEQDAPLIIPAVNKVAGQEIRALKYLHWWTFLGFFMEIGESQFSQIVSIRQKKAKRVKLEKWEREFERENHSLIHLKVKETEDARAARESMEKWL